MAHQCFLFISFFYYLDVLSLDPTKPSGSENTAVVGALWNKPGKKNK